MTKGGGGFDAATSSSREAPVLRAAACSRRPLAASSMFICTCSAGLSDRGGGRGGRAARHSEVMEWSLPVALGQMDRAGVERAILSFPNPRMWSLEIEAQRRLAV